MGLKVYEGLPASGKTKAIISEMDRLPMGLERAATGGTGSSLKQAKLKSSEKKR